MLSKDVCRECWVSKKGKGCVKYPYRNASQWWCAGEIFEVCFPWSEPPVHCNYVLEHLMKAKKNAK